MSVGGTAIITALTDVGGMLLFGYLVGQALGWGTMDSVFLGGMLSMSSTTCLLYTSFKRITVLSALLMLHGVLEFQKPV